MALRDGAAPWRRRTRACRRRPNQARSVRRHGHARRAVL